MAAPVYNGRTIHFTSNATAISGSFVIQGFLYHAATTIGHRATLRDRSGNEIFDAAAPVAG